MSKPQHDFHLVNPSPLPILSASALALATGGSVMWMHEHMIGKYVLLAGVLMVLACMYSWWSNVIKEAVIDKAHTKIVQKGLGMGMIFFITSEVMFFFAFFFAYFHEAIFPVDILEGVWSSAKGVWPPANIRTLDPWDLPFTNTLILLLSGTTVTWAHYALLENNRRDMVLGLGFTVLLGMLFTLTQAYEYHHASFALKDGVYPSIFFMATGFHGVHVIIGTIFLLVCWFRARRGAFDNGKAHLGFEFAAWYWHFVDVVWLFLFVFVYIWGR
jgi:cytochrome c oxidase subunit 3